MAISREDRMLTKMFGIKRKVTVQKNY